MRQKFNVGDFVRISYGPDQNRPPRSGIITKTKLINNHMLNPDGWVWHLDEYHCRVQTFDGASQWVRARWLEHLSKLEEG